MNTNQKTSAAFTAPLDSHPEEILQMLTGGGSLGALYGYDDQDYEVIYALGHNLYSQERYLDALKAFAFLVMHNQLEKRFMNAFASALQMLKLYQDAIQYYSMASIMDLSDPMPTFHTAECMIPLGMYTEAHQALNLVIRQSETPERVVLKERAQALLALLDRYGAGTVQPDVSTSVG